MGAAARNLDGSVLWDMTPLIRIAMFCFVAVAVSARPGSACSCAVLPVCATFWEADRVFIGRAEVTPLGPGAQRTRFEVEESFRGPAGVVEIIGRGIGGSCAYGFVDGTRYLVFARRAADGTWSSFLCGSTAPLAQAGEAITFARGIARDRSRGGSVSGAVLLAERLGAGHFGSHVPLNRATVVMREGTRELSATTSSTGQFEFKDVVPGRYTITVSAMPAVETIPPATIQIKGPGACVVHAVTAVKR
jgi:hypothetical protein